MKNFLKKIVYNINLKPFLRNVILLESNPDFSDNTKAVFDELINQNINEKYKIIWLVDDKDKFSDIKINNVSFINGKDSSKRNLKTKLLMLFSKYIIDCNSYIYKLNKYQFRVHLTHGEPIKVAREYCSGCGEVDYLIQTGKEFVDVMSDAFKVPKEKIVLTGYPRNDVLFNKSDKKLISNKKYNKFVLWMPTYRNHRNLENKKGNSFTYGVPSIKTEEELVELNDCLKKNEILLGIKLHPVEDTSNLKKINLSNIILIDNDYLLDKHLTVMSILKDTDALITDYSSTYYDYLLLDRPIGLAIEDIEEYKKSNELFYENFEKNLPAEYIYNFDDLKNFFIKIANNKDDFKDERKKTIGKFHKYVDGNSSKRVVEIITTHMKGK